MKLIDLLQNYYHNFILSISKKVAIYSIERELIPIATGYKYDKHPVREGLTFEHNQQTTLTALYSQHFASLPFRAEMDLIDAKLDPAKDQDFYIGNTTAEITFLSKIIDPITDGHMESVGRCAYAIAAEMGYNEVPLAEVYLGGRLHDIKKINEVQLLLQPDYFTLLEQGRLLQSYDEEGIRQYWGPHNAAEVPMLDTNVVFTDSQKASMRKHAVEGGKYLRRIGMPQAVSIAAEQHHAYFGFMKAQPHPLLAPHEKCALGEVLNAADFAVTSESSRVYKPVNAHKHTVRYMRLMADMGKVSPHVVSAYERACAKYQKDWMRYTIHLPNIGGGQGLKAMFGD